MFKIGGGGLILTVPFVLDEHKQSYDFGRYTSFGMKYLLEKKFGFEILEYEKSVNDLSAIFQLINDYIYKKLIGKRELKNHIIINLLCSFFNIFGILIKKITPKNNDFYLDNIILAKKIETFNSL